MAGASTPTMSSSDELIEMSDSDTHHFRLRDGIPSVSDQPATSAAPPISRMQTARISQVTGFNLSPLHEISQSSCRSRQSTVSSAPLTLQLSNDNLSISSQWGFSMASIDIDPDDSLVQNSQSNYSHLDFSHRNERIQDEDGSISMAFIDPQSPTSPPYTLYDSHNECDLSIDPEASILTVPSEHSEKSAAFRSMLSQDLSVCSAAGHLRQQSDSESLTTGTHYRF